MICALMRETGKDNKAPIVARRRIDIILSWSGSGPALNVEDRTATALAAYKPVPVASITQAEGPAANFATRHRNAAPRAERHLAGCKLVADLLQFARGVLCQVLLGRPVPCIRRLRGIIDRHQSGIRTTILPNCWPLCSRSNACRPCEMSNTESTSGIRCPAWNSLVTASNSASLPIVEPMMSH